MKTEKIPRRILGALLSSVTAGVVPRSGAPYIAIGRVDEIEALTEDLRRVSEGEGVTRFIIGRYGSGKSFLIQLIRGYAIDRGFVCADCDLSPERRLCGQGGLATYRELISNLSVKASPDGGALQTIIGRWYSSVAQGMAESGILPGDPSFTAQLTAHIIKESREFENYVGGFDFALVVSEYCKAYGDGNDEKMSACLRWLRGEYGTKTEARRQTGLPSISVIDDANWYDHIKLISVLVRKIGFSGLCVFIDEGVNLYKIVNRISREANYEKILSMYNDTMQGRAEGMMLVFGGTPQFLEDTRRGLFSYEALKSRLCDGRFSDTGLKNMMNPVMRLKRLSDTELLALMLRLTKLHGQYHGVEEHIGEADMKDFLISSLDRTGADTMITPREIIRDYVTLLDLLCQNPNASYNDIMKRKKTEEKRNETDSFSLDLQNDPRYGSRKVTEAGLGDNDTFERLRANEGGEDISRGDERRKAGNSGDGSFTSEIAEQGAILDRFNRIGHVETSGSAEYENPDERLKRSDTVDTARNASHNEREITIDDIVF